MWTNGLQRMETFLKTMYTSSSWIIDYALY